MSPPNINEKDFQMNTILQKKPKGFTLVELMITLAIAGILFTTAIPSFSNMLDKNQQTAQLYTLFHHHQLARSEAIKSNRNVLLCKSSDGQRCTAYSKWSDGWIIFSDIDNDKKISNDETVIFVQHPLSHKLSLKYKGFGSHNYIRYFPNGRSSTNGTFTLCNQPGNKEAKSIIISRTGRARLDTKTSGGKALSCS